VAHPPVDPRSFLPLTPLAFQVLLALADTNRHGYGIILEVAARTDGLITLRTGTLYTLLQRLMEDALIEPVDADARSGKGARGGQGAPTKDDPRRKYYGLTSLGREVLSAEARRLESVLSDARRKHVIKRA
jgi:DNA-binding PadR family transcriptional regulator